MGNNAYPTGGVIANNSVILQGALLYIIVQCVRAWLLSPKVPISPVGRLFGVIYSVLG